MKKIERTELRLPPLSLIFKLGKIDDSSKNMPEFANVCKFQEIIEIFTKMSDYLAKSDKSVDPENYEMALSVYKLLEATAIENREAYFRSDLEDVFKKINKKNISQEELDEFMNKLKIFYGFSYEEIQEQITKYHMIKSGLEHEFTPKMRRDYDDKSVYVNLYAFTNLEFFEDEQGKCFVVKMKPVYHGFITNIASPLRSLEIKIEIGKPVKTDFEQNFYIYELGKELSNHPIIIVEMKKRFVKIVQLYQDNFKYFVEERTQGSNGDDSQEIGTALYDYFVTYVIDDYLKRLMSEEDYQRFKSSLNIPNNEEIITAALEASRKK